MSVELQRALNRAQHELNILRSEYSEFSSMVSHELAAPFRQIEGFANIILTEHSEHLDDEAKRQFGYIIKGTETGSNIVTALSAYSNLCTQELQVTSVDANVILDEVIAQLSPLIGNTNAQCTYTALPVINVDSDLINRTFYQLLHNALHYHTPGNQPIVSVEALEDENYWKFCIKDNGIGMSENQMDKAFQMFKRSVSNKKYSGSGTGLAIAKRIVERHGGEIGLQRNEDAGCSCHFTLTKNLQAV